MRTTILFTKIIVVLFLLFANDIGYSQCCTPSTTNLVVNGGFEQQTCAQELVSPTFISSMSKQCTGASWSIGSHRNGVFAVGTSAIQSDWTANPHSGSQYFVGDGLWGSTANGDPSLNIAWSQNIPVVAGKTYQFKIWYYNEQSGSQTAPVALGFNNQTAVATSNVSINRQWTELCAKYTATTTGFVNAQVYKYNLLSGQYAGNDFGLDDIEFREINPFEIAPQPDVTICKGQSVTLPTQVLVGSGSYSYSWSTGQNTSGILVSPTTTQTYTVNITDLVNGCTKTDNITVTVIDLKLELGQDVRICVNYPTTITASPTGGSGNYAYNWSNGATTQAITLTYNQPGTYSVTVTDNIYGCTVSDNITATDWNCAGTKYYQNNQNLPSLTYYNNIAAGSSVTTSLPTGAVKVLSGQNVTFKAGQEIVLAPGFSVDTNGIFLGYIEPGCVLGDLTITKTNITHCDYQLSAESASGSGNYGYLWNTGQTTKVISVSPSVTTSYSVTVTDLCLGGTTTASYTLVPHYQGEISAYVPNFVTPNGDGHNDVWVVTDNGLTEYAFNAYRFELIVENRWGDWVWFQAGVKDVNSTGFHEGDIYWPAVNLRDDIYYAALSLWNCSNNPKEYKLWIQLIGTPSRIGQFDTTAFNQNDYNGVSSENALIIHPNPSQGKISLEIPDKVGSCEVSVEDLYGRNVYENKYETDVTNIDLQNLKPGVYYVRVKSNGEMYRSKLVISE